MIIDYLFVLKEFCPDVMRPADSLVKMFCFIYIYIYICIFFFLNSISNQLLSRDPFFSSFHKKHMELIVRDELKKVR